MADESHETSGIMYDHVKARPVFLGTPEQQRELMDSWGRMSKAEQRAIRQDPSREVPRPGNGGDPKPGRPSRTQPPLTS